VSHLDGVKLISTLMKISLDKIHKIDIQIKFCG